MTTQQRDFINLSKYRRTPGGGGGTLTVDYCVVDTGAAKLGSCTDAGLASGASVFTWGIFLSTIGSGSYWLMDYGDYAGSGDFSIIQQSGLRVLSPPAGGLNTSLGTENWADGALHLLIVTYDGVHLNAYKDGVATSASPIATTLNTTLHGANSYTIGANNGGGGAWPGSLEREFYIPSALTAGDVTTIQSARAGGPATFDAAIASFSPLHYHKTQEASGNFVDSGSLNNALTAGSGLTYQQPGALP